MPRDAPGHVKSSEIVCGQSCLPSAHGCSLPTQELVIILHKALEAAQQEKRASSAYLAATEDRDRLELVRHKVRQIAELNQRVEALEQGLDGAGEESDGCRLDLVMLRFLG